MRKPGRSKRARREAFHFPDPTEPDPFSREALMASGVRFPRQPQDDDDEICSDDGAPNSLAAWLAAGRAGPGAGEAGPAEPGSPGRAAPAPAVGAAPEPAVERGGAWVAPATLAEEVLAGPAEELPMSEEESCLPLPDPERLPGSFVKGRDGEPFYRMPRRPGEDDRARRVGVRPGRPFSRYRLDWDYAAQMLARGEPIMRVAEVLGCHRSTIWRALKSSPGLAARIEEERRRLAAEAGARLRAMRLELAEEIYHRAFLGGTDGKGDPRLLIFLARELDVFRGDYLPASPELEAPRPGPSARARPALPGGQLAMLLRTLHFDDFSSRAKRLSRNTEVAPALDAVAFDGPALKFLADRPPRRGR